MGYNVISTHLSIYTYITSSVYYHFVLGTFSTPLADYFEICDWLVLGLLPILSVGICSYYKILNCFLNQKTKLNSETDLRRASF